MVVCKGGGREVAPSYKCPFVNEVELYKLVNLHEYT